MQSSQNFDAGLEPAHIPPVDLSGESIELADVLGPSWTAQSEATLTWQAEGADRGDAYEQAAIAQMIPAIDEVGASPVAGPAPTMRTIVRMNTLMVSLRERLQQIQTEAANVAIAEMNRRQTGAGDADALPLPQLHDEHAHRIAVLANAWFDIITSAQAGMAALIGTVPGAKVAAPAERRRQAVVIGFPDRRLAGRAG